MLRKFNNHNRFVIRYDQRVTMERELQCDSKQLLGALLDIFREKAVAEISGFRVAAAAVGFSGDIYMGVNLETPLATLGQTVHAEQFVIVNAHHSKEAGLRQFVVSDYPCGHCRQFLFELPEAEKIMVDVPSESLSVGQSFLLADAVRREVEVEVAAAS